MPATLFPDLQKTSWDSIFRTINAGLTYHEWTFSSSIFDMAYSGWRVSKLADDIALLDFVPKLEARVVTYALGIWGAYCLWAQRSPPSQNKISAHSAHRRNNLQNQHPDTAVEPYLTSKRLSEVVSTIWQLTDLSLTLFDLRKNQIRAALKLATIGMVYFVNFCSKKISPPEDALFAQLMSLKSVYLSPAIKAYMIYQDYRCGIYTTNNYRLLADGYAHVYSLLRSLP